MLNTIWGYLEIHVFTLLFIEGLRTEAMGSVLSYTYI